MKNMIQKGFFWGQMAVVLAGLFVFHLAGGVPLTPLLIGIDWLFFIAILCLFRGLRKEEAKAVKHQAAAFTGEHYISLPTSSAGRFDSIMERGKSYLIIAKSKWAIGVFLLLASIFYLFRSANPSFSIPLYGEIEVTSFYIFSSILAGITFGLIIFVMWLASKMPRLCYKKASFYVLPREEERKDLEIFKSANPGTSGIIIVKKGEKCLVVPHDSLLVLPEHNSISPCQLELGKILRLGEEFVLLCEELRKGKGTKDFKDELTVIY